MRSRYTPQQMVPEIGKSGQEALESAKVLIIGAGGLGTPVATYLATAGVGKIGIVDGDTISESNLHRQFMYRSTEIGELKVQVLKKRLSELNPQSEISTFPFFLDRINAEELFNQYTIICDCSDNAETRLLTDQLCKIRRKPLVYAAVRDWQGYLTVLHHQNNIELGDLFSMEQLQETDNCSIAGIVNTTCGILGSLQACEAIKIVIGQISELDGKILCVDTQHSVFKLFRIKRANS